VDAGLGRRIAHDADGLARAFAGARVGLGALPANRQAAQMADAAVAFDALQPLQIHADLASKITLDDVFTVLNGVDDLRELLLRQVLGADAGVNLRLGQDDFRVAGADAVDVAQRNVNALVRWDFDANDTSHKFFEVLNALSERRISPAAVCDGD